MENREFAINYSKESDQFVIDVGQLIEKPLQESPKPAAAAAEKLEGLSKQEIQAILDDHFAKIESLLSNHSKHIEQIPANKPEELEAVSVGFFKKLQEALQEFKNTLKYLIADKTDDVRLSIKNGINSRVLKISDSMKQLGEKIDKKFAIEEKVERTDPREAKRIAAEASLNVKAAKGYMPSEESQKAAEASTKEQLIGDFFNPPRIKPTVDPLNQQLYTLKKEDKFNFDEVAALAFEKRAAEPASNWNSHHEKFGDQDLNQAWNVFMKDTWNLREELVSDQGKDLSEAWEKDYYDFFYEGGKEAYDAAVNNNVPVNYSATAIKQFEQLYDSHVAKSMQESLPNEIAAKQEAARATEKSDPREKADKPKNKFEQRVEEAKIKNQLIEKNIGRSINKEATNDAPIMK